MLVAIVGFVAANFQLWHRHETVGCLRLTGQCPGVLLEQWSDAINKKEIVLNSCVAVLRFSFETMFSKYLT